jgi:thioredoxin-related protein
LKITAKIPVAVLFFVLLFSSSYAQKTSFNDAMKLAKESDKRVIIDFYTDWCGWCKKMDAEAYSNKDIKEIIEDNFVFVKMNAEGTTKVKYRGVEYTESDLAINFQVTGYPTTVFLEPDGKVIEFKYDKVSMNNVPGYFKTKDFKKILEYIKDGKYKDTDLSTIVN